MFDEHCGGVAAATGRYVAFLDPDDRWMPMELARQVHDLRTRRRRWGYTHHRWIDEAGRAAATYHGRPWGRSDGWIVPGILAVKAWIAMPTVMVERS